MDEFHISKKERMPLHCNTLQRNYRVELLHREIPVVITGNEFTEYNFPLFWLHFFHCTINIEIVALVPVMCQFILQNFTGLLQGRITKQGDSCSHYRELVCSV